MDEPTNTAFTEFYGYADRHNKPHALNGWNTPGAAKARKVAIAEAGIGGRVVEIGCGTGTLAHHGDITSYDGWDIREAVLAKAQTMRPQIGGSSESCRFHQGDGFAALSSISEGTVDWVVAFGVFSLLPTEEDPVEAMYLLYTNAARIGANVMISLLDGTFQPPAGRPDIESNWFHPETAAGAALGGLPRRYHVEIRRAHLPNDMLIIGRLAATGTAQPEAEGPNPE